MNDVETFLYEIFMKLANYDENCIFCHIAKGEKESIVVFEDQRFLAFLDKRPLFLGHCLLIPKRHVCTLYDLPDRLVKSFFTYAKMIGTAVEKGMHAEGSFIAINNRISQSVPHLHIHIVPRNKQDGLRGFFWPRNQYTNEEQAREIQSKIISAIDR